MGLSEGRDGQRQATRIGADEKIHMILGQKAQDVLLREAAARRGAGGSRSSARAPRRSGDQLLHAVAVRRVVLGALDPRLLAPDDQPVGVGLSQLAGSEVVDDLTLLHVDLAVGEDEMGVVATRRGAS